MSVCATGQKIVGLIEMTREPRPQRAEVIERVDGLDDEHDREGSRPPTSLGMPGT